MSQPPEPVPQRIGDAERDRALDLLRDHLTAGRITQPEFDERMSAALSARTAADLTPLFHDLPGPRPVGPAEPFVTPPWSAADAAPAASTEVAPTPSAEVPAPRTAGGTALAIAAAAAWPATIMLLFVIGWQYWWLMFVPMMIGSVAAAVNGTKKPPPHGTHSST